MNAGHVIPTSDHASIIYLYLDRQLIYNLKSAQT